MHFFFHFFVRKSSVFRHGRFKQSKCNKADADYEGGSDSNAIIEHGVHDSSLPVSEMRIHFNAGADAEIRHDAEDQSTRAIPNPAQRETPVLLAAVHIFPMEPISKVASKGSVELERGETADADSNRYHQ